MPSPFPMINSESKAHAAFHRLLDQLREAADEWLSPESGIDREIEVVEGLRNVIHLLSGGVDFYLEGDPEHPEFRPVVSPIRKFMGDNPDAVYFWARVRDDLGYRVRGVRKDECYISFTVHGRAADGSLGPVAEPVLADVNDRQFAVADDGRYEVILSHEEPARREHEGVPVNWIELPKGAASLLTRHYFEVDEDKAPAVTRPREIEIEIDTLTPSPVRPPQNDDDFARRLDDVTAFVRGGKGLEMPDPPPFVSTTPNKLGQPTVFRLSNSDSWGAVDIAYSMGPFDIRADEALVMEGTLPECAFANVVLWNRFLQAFEYRDRTVSLNRKQIRTDADGRYRVICSMRDPRPEGSTDNWLDTEEHGRGTIFWRFLLPEGTPEKPECQVVPLSTLEKG